MGKGKITNPYLQELKERAEFRNKVEFLLMTVNYGTNLSV